MLQADAEVALASIQQRKQPVGEVTVIEYQQIIRAQNIELFGQFLRSSHISAIRPAL
ncbi:hypothetical protein JD974_22775 [Chromobacterium haemolyticum]|uniref:Uncharacterized protein n=1 Tax=Chromobacterium haemolyticum TaxID=394935 RepID=A0ABS3GTJ8_9NEIS|nr:hypothetical protein [Chromobacterium haemolyticum]MBK0417239.1 hypothetical protein [Chromobacterium haemolyticum]MBO0418380.1 hypothetical protein [Chromobacterium haemolyticum]MBO0501689.1 hypothetical protein [Chromobacterium haemolyticum]